MQQKRRPGANGATDKVRPKKSLGQHFLHDQQIARRIVEGLTAPVGEPVLEIGPGMGVLTQYLLEMGHDLKVIEIDRDSVAYLKQHYPALAGRIIEGDFLKADLAALYTERFSIIGNFPYNISSQIFFSVLEHRDSVNQVVCMLQKEVADRMASAHGSKVYGILSVLLQTYFHIDYLFKVLPGAFIPPPRVISAVIRLRRNERVVLGCDPAHFVRVVKQGFNNRRKTLRNSLKILNLTAEVSALPILDKRAEQLSVEEFIHLATVIEQSRGAAASL